MKMSQEQKVLEIAQGKAHSAGMMAQDSPLESLLHQGEQQWGGVRTER